VAFEKKGKHDLSQGPELSGLREVNLGKAFFSVMSEFGAFEVERVRRPWAEDFQHSSSACAIM